MFISTGIDRIKEKIDLLDIVSEYVVLKPRGRGSSEYVGLCPFHNEKTPSFSVNSEKGVFYCFGCGEKGDAIAFLMNLNSRGFTETVLGLAQRYDVALDERDPEVDRKWRQENLVKQQLIEVCGAAAEFFIAAHCDRSLDYLASRGITAEAIERFELGYAPDSWQQLYKTLTKQGYSSELLIQAGLVSQRNDRCYDTFRDRVIMPLFNPQGQVVGFSGRSIDPSSKPKYLNSPDSPIFKKSEIIYPYHLARQEIVAKDSAIIVEGNFDVIQFHSCGIKNAIASLGTSISKRQINKLIALTKNNNLILALDNDLAGIKAIERIITENSSNIDRQLINLKILNFPPGFKDVDEIVRTPNGTNMINQLLNTAPVWVEWQINRVQKKYDLSKGEDFALCSQGFAKILTQVSDLSLKSFYTAKCSEILARDNPGSISNHARSLAAKSQAEKYNLTTNNKTDKNNFYSNLTAHETKILICELTLAKIALFYPEFSQEIKQQLNQANWFIHDSLCRWIINQDHKPQTLTYYFSMLKIELNSLWCDRNLFESTTEFLSLDFERDRAVLQQKQEWLFSQTQAQMLRISQPQQQILDIPRQLKRIKLKEQLAAIKILFAQEKDLSKQKKYFDKMVEIKALL